MPTADFGWNYPAGAANDPRAPWNRREPDEHEVPCPSCDGTGNAFPDEDDEYEEQHPCIDCDGAGVDSVECEDHCTICGCRCKECDPDYWNDLRNDR